MNVVTVDVYRLLPVSTPYTIVIQPDVDKPVIQFTSTPQTDAEHTIIVALVQPVRSSREFC